MTFNRQSIFDRAVRHLFYQNVQATELDPRYGKPVCQYLVTNGTKAGTRCAIGGLEPELTAELTGDLEDIFKAAAGYGGPLAGAFDIVPFEPDVEGLEKTPDLLFLQTLQQLHDDPDLREAGWPVALVQFADQYDLDPEVLREFDWIWAKLRAENWVSGPSLMEELQAQLAGQARGGNL